MNRVVDRLTALAPIRKRAVIIGFDAAAMLLALWLAFCIRLGTFYVPNRPQVILLAVASVALGILALFLLNIYKVVIRYLDINAALRIASGAAAVAATWFMLAYLTRLDNLPRSVGFIYFGIVYLLMFFGRLAVARLLNGDSEHVTTGMSSRGEPNRETCVAIFGATSAGSSLAEALRRHPRYRLRCFVDDNPALVGRAMMGVPIRSSVQLRHEIQAGAVEQIFLVNVGDLRAGLYYATLAHIAQRSPGQVLELPALLLAHA